MHFDRTLGNSHSPAFTYTAGEIFATVFHLTLRTQMRRVDAEHALMFRRLASRARREQLEQQLEEGQEGLLGGWIFPVEACVTGLEYNTDTDKMETSECIDSVFAMVTQDKLPKPAELGYFIAYHFREMGKNKDPWIKRFAFVLSTGIGMIRKVCGI